MTHRQRIAVIEGELARHENIQAMLSNRYEKTNDPVVQRTALWHRDKAAALRQNIRDHIRWDNAKKERNYR